MPDQPADPPTELEADLGQLRRLARAGLSRDDHHLVVPDRVGDVVAPLADRQIGIGHLGDEQTPSVELLRGERHGPDSLGVAHECPHLVWLAGLSGGRAQSGPAGLEPSDRHPERRARHVVQPDAVEEVNGVRVTAMLAAHAEVQVRAGRPSLAYGDLDEPADPVDVQRLERATA